MRNGINYICCQVNHPVIPTLLLQMFVPSSNLKCCHISIHNWIFYSLSLAHQYHSVFCYRVYNSWYLKGYPFPTSTPLFRFFYNYPYLFVLSNKNLYGFIKSYFIHWIANFKVYNSVMLVYLHLCSHHHILILELSYTPNRNHIYICSHFPEGLES